MGTIRLDYSQRAAITDAMNFAGMLSRISMYGDDYLEEMLLELKCLRQGASRDGEIGKKAIDSLIELVREEIKEI